MKKRNQKISHSSTMENTTTSESVIQIRLAQLTDVNRLVKISRGCFTHILRWQGPEDIAIQWWEHILKSDYCEVWVCTVRDKVVGYINLVWDIDKHYQERQQYNGGIKVGWYLLRHHPCLIGRHIINKVLQTFLTLIRMSKCTLTEEAYEKNRIIWIRPVAVERSMQGMGLGTELIEMALKRAYELDYNKVRLGVDRVNIKAVNIYQRLHFNYIGSTCDCLYYEREITESQASDSPSEEIS